MRVPVPVIEIIDALERESRNTDTDPRWLAANELRRMEGWLTRTLMCHVEKWPSETVTPKPGAVAPDTEAKS